MNFFREVIIGDNLKRLRLEAGISQGQLLEAMGKKASNQPWLSKVEANEYRPKLDTVEALSVALAEKLGKKPERIFKELIKEVA